MIDRHHLVKNEIIFLKTLQTKDCADNGFNMLKCLMKYNENYRYSEIKWQRGWKPFTKKKTEMAKDK